MLSIIILNHNDTYHTKRCLKSLQEQTFDNFEIILVENGSNESFKNELYNFLKSNQLKNQFMDKIKIIDSKENLGFPGGVNLGIKNSRGDLLLMLNNDTIHESSFLETMVEFFEKYDFIHIAQPKICYFNNKNTVWQNGGKINKFSFNLFRPIDSMKKEIDVRKKPFKIDFAVGCALFIRRDIIKKIGLLEKIYFLYCDDPDLCYRASLKGYKNIYCNPKTKIYHNIKSGLPNGFKKFCFRNRMIFCLKYFSIPLIIWQFFIQFIHLFILTIDFKKKSN
ncbi:MAG: glycosyltransferase family 2 protein [Candidatus Hodarchaeota archaeon]